MSCADETQSLYGSKAAMETETQHGEGEQSLPRQCRRMSTKETEEEEEEDTTTRAEGAGEELCRGMKEKGWVH